MAAPLLAAANVDGALGSSHLEHRIDDTAELAQGRLGGHERILAGPGPKQGNPGPIQLEGPCEAHVPDPRRDSPAQDGVRARLGVYVIVEREPIILCHRVVEALE